MSAVFLNAPENIAVIVGERVTIGCPPDSNDSVKWAFNANSDKTRRLELTEEESVYKNASLEFDFSEGNRFLILNFTEERYAGAYECRQPGVIFAAMQLIVLGNKHSDKTVC